MPASQFDSLTLGDRSLIDAYVNALSVNAHLAERIWYLWRHGHISDEMALATWGLLLRRRTISTVERPCAGC